jgi:hypothetical protein
MVGGHSTVPVSDDLEDRLGDVARRLFGELGVRRSSELTLPKAELEIWAEERGWPTSSEVLAAEAMAGGYTHPRGGIFGLVGSMHCLAEGLVPPFHAPPFDRVRYDPRTGAPLLPMWLGEDPFLWLAMDGSLHYGSHADGREYFSPAFDSVVSYWEVLLLLRGHVVTLTPPWTPVEPRLEVGGEVAELLAEALGLVEDEVARGSHTRAFASPDAAVVWLDAPGFFEGTLMATHSVEAVALAAVEALGVCDDAVMTLPSPLDADLLADLPPPRLVREGAGSVYRWGKLGQYRDAAYRDRHRSSDR